MIERYILSPEGIWLHKVTRKPMETRDGLFVPMVLSDTPSYTSPVTGKPIDGKAARREDLKRSNSREVDPGEYKPTYHSKERAIAHGREWEPRPAVDLGNGYRRLPATRER